MKLKVATAQKERCELKKNQIGNLLKSNRALEQELVSLNFKLKDSFALEDYEKVKNEKQTLTKQSILLQKQVQETKQKLDEQNQLEEKNKKSEEKLRILCSNNTALEEEFEELKNKLKFGDKIRKEYSTLRKETKIMLNYNYALQDKISELQHQYNAEKYWIDEYNQMKNHCKELDRGNTKLRAEYQKIDNELRKIKVHPSIHPFSVPASSIQGLGGAGADLKRSTDERQGTPWTGHQSIAGEIKVLKQNCGEIQSTMQGAEDKNVSSCLKEQELKREQKDFKNKQGMHKKCTESLLCSYHLMKTLVNTDAMGGINIKPMPCFGLYSGHTCKKRPA
ncbi:hypothetical protein ATANTOWER_032058 [Ataeniobius toweri]|uniref:Uncharacterized protein n=1 Tax=Ataeniobius toweri TaxID=208326 RepID=A0ABU7B9W7_9TELE|nr:hypothetical protein [Ataeniobius toweri]